MPPENRPKGIQRGEASLSKRSRGHDGLKTREAAQGVTPKPQRARRTEKPQHNPGNSKIKNGHGARPFPFFIWMEDFDEKKRLILVLVLIIAGRY